MRVSGAGMLLVGTLDHRDRQLVGAAALPFSDLGRKADAWPAVRVSEDEKQRPAGRQEPGQ